MLDNNELIYAVGIQQKCYTLLKWLQGGMDQGFFPPEAAHQRLSTKQVTKHWLARNIHNLPKSFTSGIENETDLDALGNFFSTYLLSTFEIDPNPGEKLFSEGAHCFCPMCSYMVSVSHLKTRKIENKDKKRAVKLKIITLKQLCIEESIVCADSIFEQFLDKQNKYEKGGLFESTSVLAYAFQLIQRVKGVSEGTGVLVLWREFAWNEQGSPKKKFKFEEDLVINAKNIILMKLRSLANSST